MKSNGSIMMCPTKGNFKQKDAKKYGIAVGRNITNYQLGMTLRDMLKQCD